MENLISLRFSWLLTWSAPATWVDSMTPKVLDNRLFPSTKRKNQLCLLRQEMIGGDGDDGLTTNTLPSIFHLFIVSSLPGLLLLVQS